MGKDKEHVVVGNGVIRSKADMAEYKKKQEDTDGGNGDVAELGETADEDGGSNNGDAAQGANDAGLPKVNSATPTSRAQMGDNTSAEQTSTSTTDRKNTNTRLANKKTATPAEPKPKKNEQPSAKTGEDAQVRKTRQKAKGGQCNQ